jgi:hypothetical protein
VRERLDERHVDDDEDDGETERGVEERGADDIMGHANLFIVLATQGAQSSAPQLSA